MAEFSRADIRRACTPHGTLAALGLHVRHLDLFGPIRQRVQIKQKVVRYTPIDKLYDAFIAILAGAHGLVEINTRLRSDAALQAAFGRTACAEQSVVQDTLDACDAASVTQMEQALDAIFRQHSQAYHHAYRDRWQLLDVDMTGLPCGPKAAFATPGYFARHRNRRGRQLGRVLATRYHELVVDRLYDGTIQLRTALRPLLEAAERTLELDPNQRKRTIVRVDAGGGSVGDVNWILARGYEFHGKDCSGRRAAKLAATVTTWVDDPRYPGRQVGWAEADPAVYGRRVRRIAVRCRKKNGQWGIGVLISTLSPAAVLELTGQGADQAHDPQAVLLAYVYCYDQRGGGVETATKDDKQGLGLGKRNKRRFAAQQMLVSLSTLAHNVIVWARRWLSADAPLLAGYGIQRMVRDAFQVTGVVEWDHHGTVSQIVLNQMHCLAHRLVAALQTLAGARHVVIRLGET